MALAPYTAPTLSSDSPAVAAWIATHAAALQKGAKLREIIRGCTAAGKLVRVVGWRAGGPPFLRVDGGTYGGDPDMEETPTLEAVARLLACKAPDAAWEDPRVARAPSAPGVWLHQDAAERWRSGGDAGKVIGQGSALVVGENGTCVTVGPSHYARWTAADTQAPAYLYAGGLTREDAESHSWIPVARALEQWRTIGGLAAAPAAAAKGPAEPLKLGEVVPAAKAVARLPERCIAEVQGGGENSAVFHMRGDRLHWIKGSAGGLSDHGGPLLDRLIQTWDPSEFCVLALDVPETWNARSARVLAGVEPAEPPRKWADVPAWHLARNARGLVAWKQADSRGVFVRCLWNDALDTRKAASAADREDFCDAQGPWTVLTGPHETPADADAALALLERHGRLAPEAPASRTWKVGDIVRTAEEAATLPPGAILREGPNAETRDLVAVLQDRTMSYLRRAEEVPPGTSIDLEDGWTSAHLLEEGPAEIVALADPARLGDSAYMCELLGWRKADPAPEAGPVIVAADPGATSALHLKGVDVRLTIKGPDGKPIELKGFGSGDFASLEAPGALRVTLAPEAAQALEAAVLAPAVAAQAPRGDAEGAKPGDRVPWAQVPPGSLVLDEDGDPIWRMTADAWRRIGIGASQAWRKMYDIDRDYTTPARSRECLVVCTGVPESAELGDLVGLAIASGHAPSARGALSRLPQDVRERALKRAADAGQPAATVKAGDDVEAAEVPPGAVAECAAGLEAVAAAAAAGGRFAAAEAALARAADLFGEDVVRDVRWIAREVSAGHEVKGVDVHLRMACVRASVRGGKLHAERTCDCATCARLPACRPVPLEACVLGGSEAAGAAEVLALLAGLSDGASEIAPWAGLHTVSAATLRDFRPDLGGSGDAQPEIDAVRWGAVADSGVLGSRRCDLGALSAQEVEPWRWDVSVDQGRLLWRSTRGSDLRWAGVALCGADAIAQAMRGTALDFGGDEEAVRAAVPLPYAVEDVLLGSAGLAWYKASGRLARVGTRVYCVYAAEGDAQIALPQTRSRIALRLERPCLVAVTHVVTDRPPSRGAVVAELARLARGAWGPKAPKDARAARGAEGPGLFLHVTESRDGRTAASVAVGPGAPRDARLIRCP